MTRIGPPLAAALWIATLGAAHAADPVYPPGSRIGLVPMTGLAAASEFPGFESDDKAAKLVIAELPAAAFEEVDTAVKSNQIPPGANRPEPIDTAAGTAYFTSESTTENGQPVKRFAMILAGGIFSGYVALQTPADNDKWPEAGIKAMFATAALRKQVPVEEQLGLLPYKVKELADFRTVRTLAPGAVLFADGDEEKGIEGAPFMVIGLIAGNPSAQGDERARFAQQAAANIPGLRDAKLVVSEPMRIDGQPGFETRIEAVTGKNDTPVTVVQWLRFGSSNLVLRIIGNAPRDEWPKAFPRFRAVRDGVTPK